MRVKSAHAGTDKVGQNTLTNPGSRGQNKLNRLDIRGGQRTLTVIDIRGPEHPYDNHA